LGWVRKEKRSKTIYSPEWKEGVWFVKWCFMNHIEVIHIANEGKRSLKSGAILRAMGMVSGTPDFVIPIPRNGYGSLWLEMKQARIYTLSERKKPTWIKQEQKINELRELGNVADFSFGWVQAARMASAYLGINASINF
jgi:hypothetical protein